MSQDPNQYPPNNYPQDQPHEPPISEFPPTPNAGNQGYPPPSPSSYPSNSTQPTSSSPSYPAPSYGAGQNYNNVPGYPPAPGYPGPQVPGYPPASSYPGPQAPGNEPANPYTNPSPYMQNQPQPGMFPVQGPYGAPGGGSFYPGYMPFQQPKKRKTWLWVTLSIVGGVLVIGIIACSVLFYSLSSYIKSVDSNSTLSTTSAPGDTGDTPDLGGTPVALSAVGMKNTLQELDCTVTAVKQIPGDENAQPKTGDEFIVIQVQFVNNSPETQHYDPFDFKITDSAGKSSTYINVVPAAYDSPLSANDLNPGNTFGGYMVFEVSSSDHTQTLSWDTVANQASANPGEAKWVLAL